MAERKRYNDPKEEVKQSDKQSDKHSERTKPMGTPYTLEEIEKIPGDLDEDDFYTSKDGLI
jgi:hypothetical protein